MIKVIRKPGQNNDGVQKSFKKAVREARFINELKKTRYRKKDPTQAKVRDRAISREKYRAIRKKEARMAL